MAACDEYLEYLSLYVDNAIDDATLRAKVEAHIAVCPECKEAADALKALSAMLADLPEPELPEGFHEQMMAGVRAYAQTHNVLPLPVKRKSFFTDINWRGYASAAAGVVLAVAGLGVVSTFSRATLLSENKTIDSPSIESMPFAVASSESDGNEKLGMQIMLDSADIAIPPTEAAMDIIANTRAFSYASVPMENTVRQYNLTITPDNFDEAVRLIKETSGVLLDSSVNYYEETSRYGAHRDGYFTKSVPAQDFDTVLVILRGLGEVDSENQSQYAVTYAIADAEARLTAKQTEYDRLMALLEQTEDVKSMLLVDARLQTVISEMESYRRMLKSYDSNISESILSLRLTEEVPAIIVKVEPETFVTKLVNAFIGSVNGTATFLEWSLVSLSGLFLPLVLLAAVLFVVVVIIRKRTRRRNHEK